MTALFVSVLILAGALFCLVASLGILRMPDLLMRMHAATKAGTLGAGLILLAAAFALGSAGAAVRAGAAILFLLLTAPVAAHLIGRAAYRSGQLRLWQGTRVDELRGVLRDIRVPAGPARDAGVPGVAPSAADDRAGGHAMNAQSTTGSG
jgi:multicomponent Na+:H+ antiporter subunit G